jgi:hypothetical protein
LGAQELPQVRDIWTGTVAHEATVGGLDKAVSAASRRVGSCDCGLETSCSGCLRTPRNERYHEDLSRGAALAILDSLSGLRPEDAGR